jgi:hypothetical protein
MIITKNIVFPVAGNFQGKTIFDAFIAARIRHLQDCALRTNLEALIAINAFRVIYNWDLLFIGSGHWKQPLH